MKKWVRRGASQARDESTVYIDGLFEHHRWRRAGGGQSSHVVIRESGNRVALVRTGEPPPDDGGPPVRYQLADHLGSATVEVGDDGKWVNREEFFSYGETSFGSFARKRYRHAGKERDEESGLHYYGARYYASHLARWTSIDPGGPADGLNRLLFCRQNPLVLVDSDGQGVEGAANEIPPETNPISGTSDAPPSYTARGAGGVCTACWDPNDPVMAQRMDVAARSQSFRRAREAIDQAQAWYDAIYPVFYEDEAAKTTLLEKMFPTGVTDDPVQRRVEALIGRRPQQVEQAVLETLIWMAATAKTPSPASADPRAPFVGVRGAGACLPAGGSRAPWWSSRAVTW